MITMSGKPCSGKSTISKILKKDYGFEIFSVGDIFREIATQQNMTVNELNDKLTNSLDSKLDIILDTKVLEMYIQHFNEDVIIESRTAPCFAPLAYKVYTNITTQEQIKRLVNSKRKNEDISPEKALFNLTKRENDESERYLELYHFDNRKLSHYDHVLDTSNITPQQGAKQVFEGYLKYKEARKNSPEIPDGHEFSLTFKRK